MKDSELRVSHRDRVNSKNELNSNSGFFNTQKIKLPLISDTFVVAGTLLFSISFFAFLFFANATQAFDITKESIISLANKDRGSQGLQPLRENSKLADAAIHKASDMINKNYFAHTSPEGLTPWHWIDGEKYDYNYAGENLAMDFTAAEKMNDAWMASPTHRANIMNSKYKDIGVGIVRGVIDNHETIAVVQMFGSGDKSSPQEEKAETNKVNSQNINAENSELPRLPLDQQKQTKLAFSSFAPIITYPVNEGIIPDQEVNVLGRALPGSKVAVYDDNNFIGETVSDERGWFKIAAGKLSSGSHNLMAKSQPRLYVKFKFQLASQNVIFAIDPDLPEVRYQMEETSLGVSYSYSLKIFLNKLNCSVKLAGQTFPVGKAKSITVHVPKIMLSAVIKVEDEAGNRVSKEADFSNLYTTVKSETLIKKFAQALNGGERSADSGREAFVRNLGLKLADSNY
jgi:hypothetical protein